MSFAKHAPDAGEIQDRGAILIPFVRYGPGPSGGGFHGPVANLANDPQLAAFIAEVVEMARPKAEQPPKGTVGAEKVAPDFEPEPWQRGDARGRRFKLVPFDEIRFSPSEEWLIKRLLPRQGLAVLFGLPRSFKSFVAMDLAFHVALGWDWAGRRTTQGAALYIAAENAGGTRKRKIGFEQAHDANLPGRVPFYMIETAPDLGTEEDDLDDLITSVIAVGVKPSIIVVDTLAQALGGGEENSTGMVNFVANTTALAVRFGCCVIAIHHVPLADEKRLRGHTSLNGGADALLLTERKSGDLTTILSLEKLKDEEDNIKLVVRLSRIVIGWDDDGDEVSTLVITRVEPLEGKAVEKGKPPKAIPRSRRLLIEVTGQALNEAGCEFRSFPDGPMVRAVHDEAVRLRYYIRIAEQAEPGDTPEQIAERQRKGFNRAVKNALDAKDIVARSESDKRFLWFP